MPEGKPVIERNVMAVPAARTNSGEASDPGTRERRVRDTSATEPAVTNGGRATDPAGAPEAAVPHAAVAHAVTHSAMAPAAVAPAAVTPTAATSGQRRKRRARSDCRHCGQNDHQLAHDGDLRLRQKLSARAELSR